MRGALAIALGLLLLAVGAVADEGQDQSDAASLIEEARTQAKLRKYESCYGIARQAAAADPDAAQALQAFEVGAYCHLELYKRDRPIGNHVIESRWLDEEQQVMFEWAASFFQGDSYPEEAMNTLVVGYPYAVWQAFKEFAATRPEISRYRMRVSVDNGIVQLVSIGDEPGLRD